MPNCENLLLMGKGGASVFCPPKSSEMCFRIIPDGNYAVPGGADIQHQAHGVTAVSDVNDWVKVRDNTGITVAAGVVAGAWKRSSKCFKNRSEGEWPE